MPNENIDFLTDTILNSENPFVLACKKIKERGHFQLFYLKKKTVILNLYEK